MLAVKETTDLPVFATLTLGEDGRTLYGTDPAAALVTLEALALMLSVLIAPADRTSSMILLPGWISMRVSL